ncbi:MAG: DUF559 domain-containing protein [Sphingomicrobium sp.]
MILPEPGRGTAPAGRGGGGGSLRQPAVYIARKLRRELSLPEGLLWRELRGKKHGFKVRSQHPIGPYVVDFYVADAALVIEIDGEAHNRDNRPHRDAVRDTYLERHGCRIVRFAAADLLSDLERVLAIIAAELTNPLHHPADGPPPRAREDF